ncbi:hypothetical protein I4U23_002034 [Adineta vaga]|nr:hypothetical protein I4U23_002034 [Adineta vaga]
MGCGTSNNVVNNDTQPVSNASFPPASIPSQRQQQQNQRVTEHVVTASQTSKTGEMSNTMNVLITCHTDQQNLAEILRKTFTNQNLGCYILNETNPQSIAARANLIQWCNAFIVIISRKYQQTPYCMETINYAKDLRKAIVAIYIESNFQPYGALGAISASAVLSLTLKNNQIPENMTSQIINAVSSQKTRKSGNKNVVDPAQMPNESDSMKLIDGNNPCTILICTTNDGSNVAQIIYEEFRTKNVDVALENLSKANSSSSVRQCTVFLPILSSEFEQIPICQTAFEKARRLQKPIVPVIAIKDWRPDGWIGLIIAGTTFFRIFDKNNAYKKFFDSNRMTDLTVEVQLACQPRPNQAEREQKEMMALKQKIEECKKELQTWPPTRKERSNNPTVDRQPVRVELSEPSAKLAFHHIHHEITRMDIKAPPALIDEYGLPKRKEIDCMISYQWDHQPFVRKVFEDMSMREIKTWFDIWGSMQGNTNDAMATGVECAKVLLVFLSKAYVQSPNCLLEFRYAVKRGKAFVIIRVEPNIPTEQWMLEAITGFPQYDVYSYEDLETLINGVPTIDVIMRGTYTCSSTTT